MKFTPQPKQTEYSRLWILLSFARNVVKKGLAHTIVPVQVAALQPPQLILGVLKYTFRLTALSNLEVAAQLKKTKLMVDFVQA